MADCSVPIGFKTPWGQVTEMIETQKGDRLYKLEGGNVSLLTAMPVEEAYAAFLEVQRKEFEKTRG